MLLGVLGGRRGPDPMDVEIEEKRGSLARAAGISHRTEEYLKGATAARKELSAARKELKRLEGGEPPYMELVEEGRPGDSYPHHGSIPSGSQFSGGRYRPSSIEEINYSRQMPRKENSDEFVRFLKEEIESRAIELGRLDSDVKEKELRAGELMTTVARHKEWVRLHFKNDKTLQGAAYGAVSGGFSGWVLGNYSYQFWPVIILAGIFGGVAAGAYVGRRLDGKIRERYNDQIAEWERFQHSYESERARLLSEKKLKESEVVLLRREMEGMTPDLEVRAVFDRLIEETYSPVDIVVSNVGKGPAYDVVCKLTGPIDGETVVKFKRIEQREQKKRLSLKPTARGKMRWVFDLTYRDHVGKEYIEEHDQWIDSAFFAQPTQVSIGQIIGDVAGRDIGKTFVDNKGGVMNRTDVGGKRGN